MAETDAINSKPRMSEAVLESGKEQQLDGFHRSISAEQLSTNQRAKDAGNKDSNLEISVNDEPNVSYGDVIRNIIDYLRDVRNYAKERQCKVVIMKWFAQALSRYNDFIDKYEVIYFLSERLLSSKDADDIYKIFEKRRTGQKEKQNSKPVLLILHSFGGFTGNAYLIGKMLQELSNIQLEIAIPRQAKSAATLLCCAGSHIHMGALSELGPIDPQMRDGPALGVKATLQHLAQLATECKESIPPFIGYMTNTIDPLSVGYSERVTESSMQYAERLLQAAHKEWSDEKIKAVARRLTYEYKDHGFVIDKQECSEMFGDDVVCQYTKELQFADAVYKEFTFVSKIAKVQGYNFSMVGDLLGQTFSERKG